MKLFLLDRDEDNCNHDEIDSVLIRARSEKQARMLANSCHATEGRIWEDPELVSCEIVTAKGQPGIIMSSFLAG